MRRSVATLLLVGMIGTGVAAPAGADEAACGDVTGIFFMSPSIISYDEGENLFVVGVNGTPCDEAVTYDWDFDQDGDYDDRSGQLVYFDPADWMDGPGSHVLGARAVADGETFTGKWPIQVTSPEGAGLSVSLGADATTTVGTSLPFLATATGYPEGSTLTYSWDLDDDGDYDDVADPSQGYVSVTWDTPGTHAVRVRLRHDQMAPGDPPATDTALVTVSGTITLGAVKLAGTPRAGQTLTANGATPTPGAATRTWEWLRDGRMIATTGVASYRLTSGDAGRRIAVRVRAGLDGWTDATPVTSPGVAVAALNLTRPSVAGTTRVGRTLTGRVGSWVAPGHTTTYRWLRDGRPITGATRTTYVATRADRGHRLSFRVVKRRSGFPTVVATSPARTISR